MKKFVFKIFSFSALTYFFLLVSHLFLVSELNKEDGYLPQGGFDYTLKNKDFNVLWLGNSRTYVHIDQREFNKENRGQSYSLVQDGGDPSILFYKIKNYLQNNEVPKKINIQCDYTMAKSNFDPEDIRVSQFFNFDMYKFLKNTYVWIEPIYFYIPLISFDVKTIIKIIIKYKPERFYNGYYSVDESWGYRTELSWNHEFESDSFDLTKSYYLDSIVKVCVDANIPEINFWTPPSSVSLEISKKYIPSIDSVSAYYSLKYERQISYIDLRDTISFNDPALFYNHTHLNVNGVNVLTNSIKVNAQALLELND